MDYKDFDLKNHECIAEFLRTTQNSTCDISGSIKATIAQFLMNFRIEINKRASALGQNWISPIDIIDSQVCELRRCVIDLEAYKERLKKGVIAQ
ncbi:hypothetical protein [Legionella maceachernii]|uniref:Uncharacterized protein n=1 Tax=Legionella maceachernii TaxID=466 RepID=A0A0W0WBG0_9GAMM|nr:hypothetical protein [Legionella maceachernii]KTD29697.1 hypothetical protein Lmac_0872 [Legionella maceachernii]SKA21314.1 hypothetical protein SAMN02745128_02616 [Legionella maceachernii]SUP02552.1 Uncharacterised protein [Legionella maceachernii]